MVEEDVHLPQLAVEEQLRPMRNRREQIDTEISKIEQKDKKFDPKWEEDTRFPPIHIKRNKAGPSQHDAVDAGSQDDAIDSGSSANDQPFAGPTAEPVGTTRVIDPTAQIHFICKVIEDTHDLHIKRARVLMVVNVDFDKHKNRFEAKEDYNKLRQVFIDELGYENYFVEALQNKREYGLDQLKEFKGITAEMVGEYSWTGDQMLAIIKSLAQTPYDGDALLLFVGSHGNCIDGRDVVSGSDSKPVRVDDIIEILDKNCDPSVRNIPKFVFVQACRGDKPIPLTDIEEIGKGTQVPSTEGIIHDPMPAGDFQKLTLEEEAPATHGIGIVASTETSDAGNILDQRVSDRQNVEEARTTAHGTEPTMQDRHEVTPDILMSETERQGAGADITAAHSNMSPPALPMYKSEKAAGDATPAASDLNAAARDLSATAKDIRLPDVPRNFLIVYSAPKGCWSGRIPTENYDPLINEGSIFAQTFAMHLEQCLCRISDNNHGIALLPLLTGVQNEVAMQWLEIGVIEHRLTKVPVLGKSTENQQ